MTILNDGSSPSDEDGYNEFHNRPELIKKRAHMILVQRILVVIVCIGLAAVLSLLTFDAINGARVRNQLLDCTTPPGKCYKESQERTNEVVAKLYDQGIARETKTRAIVLLSVSCIDKEGEQTYPEVLRCVKEKLGDNPLSAR